MAATDRGPSDTATTPAEVVRLPEALGERIDIRPTVESLRPLIVASEDRMEEDRRLPQELVEAMYAAGIFQTIHPREFGGLELHPLDWLELCYELARINGSVGWIAMLQNGALHLLEPKLLQELYDQGGGRFIVAGSHGRIGKAYPVEGGYRFTGDWAFASGAPWATHITAYAYVMGEDDEPLKDPYSGGPMYVDGIFRRDEVEYDDRSWNSLGLRGTGSGQFSLKDAFCERHLVGGMPDAAYRDRALFAGLGPNGQAAVVLGIAHGAIDRFAALASAKRGRASWANRANTLGQQQHHQLRIAHADSMIRAARAWIWELAQRQYDEAFTKDASLQYEVMIDTFQSGTYAARVSNEAMNLVFDIAGSDSVIVGRGIERCFRDVHTANQHTVTLEESYAAPGQYRLTRDQPGGPHVETEGTMLPPPPVTGDAARVWLLDPLHSTVGFRVKHHAVGTFRGHFQEIEASYDSDAGTLTGSAKAASIQTFAMLEEHLLGPDFLAAAAHPEISFASSAVLIDGDAVVIDGELTLRGVSKPVTATGTIAGPSRDAGFGADSEFVAIEAQLTIDRRDFGMAFNNELLDGQMNLGWNVTLTFSLEFSRGVQDS